MRTLVSGQATAEPSSERKSGAQDETLAIIWSCTAELFLMGERYGKLKPRADRLTAQLDAPDAWRHQKFVEASERFRRWDAELTGIERRLGPLLDNLSAHYGKLNQRNRWELVAGAGWPQESDPERFAMAVWERAAAGGEWFSGEIGFSLAPLREWVRMQMEQERRRIAESVIEQEAA